MDTLWQDFRYAARTLIRMRGAALVAIVTLAVGIGATTTIFSVVYAGLMRPLPFAEPERLVMLYTTRATAREGVQRLRWSMPEILALRTRVSGFESVAAFTASNV